MGAASREPHRARSQRSLLLFSRAPRRPLHVDDHGLAERLAVLAELDEDDRNSLLSVLDALITRKRLRALAGNEAS